ncbi:MAG: PcfK-like family protein [Clostridia bacterium]|nr:PcfK-like family protein [Clostridia bacterium]
MVQEAIEKIKNEMDSEKDDLNVQCIGEYILELIEREPSIAEKIMQNGKHITGAYKAIEEEARKLSKGRGGVCIPDSKGFEIVRGYFGIDHTPVERKESVPAPESLAPSFSLSLAELL